MSGVCGILRFDQREALRGDIERQLRALRHLGPDGRRALCDGSVAFGRLAMQVTREDRFDVQPLAAAEGRLLVADVRLDNRAELVAELGVAGPLDELPDSILVMAAYARWGEDCAARLLGDFVFAVWDPGRRRLVLARDHMGQRHVYFHRGTGFFAFATEIKGLWALPDSPRAISEAGLARRLLADGDGETETLFEGIEALPGGTVLSVGADGEISRRRYWAPRADPAHIGQNEAYYRQAYREVLGEAVACRVRRATRPVALFLSGGFDSAGIAALAGPALGGSKLVGVTSVAASSPADQAQGAAYWAGVCARQMPHLELRRVARDGADILSSAARLSLQTDKPASPNAYALEALCREAAAAGARVVLDGYGGDYTINPRGGRPLARLLRLGRLRTFIRELLAQRRWGGVSLWRSLRIELAAAIAPRGWLLALARRRSGLPARGLIHSVAADFARQAMADGITPMHRRTRPGVTELRAISLRTLQGAQNNPTQGGVIYGAHGLQLTEPFHDKRVVELALAIPEDLYFRDGRPRHLARTALADLLPPEFQRPPLLNIPLIPDYAEMIDRIRPQLMDEIERLETNPNLASYFDFARMRRLLSAPGGRRGGAGYRYRQAARTFLCAQYLDAFRRDNL